MMKSVSINNIALQEMGGGRIAVTAMSRDGFVQSMVLSAENFEDMRDALNSMSILIGGQHERN